MVHYVLDVLRVLRGGNQDSVAYVKTHAQDKDAVSSCFCSSCSDTSVVAEA